MVLNNVLSVVDKVKKKLPVYVRMHVPVRECSQHALGAFHKDFTEVMIARIIVKISLVPEESSYNC